MEQNPREAGRFSNSQVILRILWNRSFITAFTRARPVYRSYNI